VSDGPTRPNLTPHGTDTPGVTCLIEPRAEPRRLLTVLVPHLHPAPRPRAVSSPRSRPGTSPRSREDPHAPRQTACTHARVLRTLSSGEKKGVSSTSPIRPSKNVRPACAGARSAAGVRRKPPAGEDTHRSSSEQSLRSRAGRRRTQQSDSSHGAAPYGTPARIRKE